MAARIPVFFNPTTNRLEEIVTSDSVQLDMQTDIKFVTETVVGNLPGTSLVVSGGTLTIDTSQGTAFCGALSNPVTTWAFTNVPTTNGKLITVTVILQGSATNTYGDACSVNGTSITNGVKWAGGLAPTSTNNIDIISFILMKDNSGTVFVIGSSSTNIS